LDVIFKGKKLEELFKEQSQKILIYMSVETIDDPEDLNVSHSQLNSLPIDAIVTDVAGESMSWKTGGIITTDSKEIVCEKKYKSLLKLSYKIEVEGEEFIGYKKNGQMQIKNLDSNYIRLYIHREK